MSPSVTSAFTQLSPEVDVQPPQMRRCHRGHFSSRAKKGPSTQHIPHAVLGSTPQGKQCAQKLSLSQQQKARQISRQGTGCPPETHQPRGTMCIFKTLSQPQQEGCVLKMARPLPTLQQLPSKPCSKGCPAFVYPSVIKMG